MTTPAPEIKTKALATPTKVRTPRHFIITHTPTPWCEPPHQTTRLNLNQDKTTIHVSHTGLYSSLLNPKVHANPDKSYYRHGNYYFTPAFWETYCKLTGSKLLHMETTPVYRKDNPHHELYAVVQHSDSFMTRERWDAEMTKHYHRWQ